MICRAELVRCVPGFVAALLMAMLPACASGRAAQDGPIIDPHIQVRHAPRDAEVPAGISRGATGYHPDIEEYEKAAMWHNIGLVGAAVVLGVGVLYLIVLGLGMLVQVIRDALDDIDDAPIDSR